MQPIIRSSYCLLVLIFYVNIAFSQQPTDSITLPASGKYYKSHFYQALWGRHYRKVWHTPITVKKVDLDTLMGGLTPYEAGGSRQTKSLKLRDKNNREYVLRSVDKTFGGALPSNIRGTLIETMADDQVTISNPYGALIVAPLAEAVGILHTNPELVYVPKQPALKEFNDEAGDVLYMLEQRPDEDWETATNFANAKKIIGTDKMLEKEESVDEKLFVRSRLFDMFINDWGRHEDQWRWAETKNGDSIIYKPIPRDRDNAFTKFDGFAIGLFKPDHLQSFKKNLDNVPNFNFTARRLDRKFAANLGLEEWLAIATDMQVRLTDTVIINAVHALPKGVLPLLETEYVEKLESRRDKLTKWATTYYNFIENDGKKWKKGPKLILFYNKEDRIHAGLRYTFLKTRWFDEELQRHSFAVKYSFDQKGFSFSYDGTLFKLFGDWNFNLAAVYDQIRWLNFFGIGNESKLTTLDRDYFRFRHKELYIESSIEKVINNRQRIKIAPFIQHYIPITDTERYVSKTIPYDNAANFESKYFTGISAEYVYQRLNDSSLPTKGFGIKLRSTLTQPITDKTKSAFERWEMEANGFLPFTKTLGYAVKVGAATLTGDTPEFYQFNTVGGTRTIRGYQRERFHGTTTFYNQNELRWIKDVRSYLYNGKLGIYALYDIGRVFEKDETSGVWHAGYGGGVVISPFYKVTVFISYAKSVEDKNLHIAFVKNF